MPVSGRWDNPEKTIYRTTFANQWTLAEVAEAGDEYVRTVTQVAHPVVCLVDMRQSPVAPSGNIFQAGVLAFREPIPNEDLIVVMTGSRLLRQTGSTFIGILQKLFPERRLQIVWAGSEPEAYRIIEQYWRDNGLYGRG